MPLIPTPRRELISATSAEVVNATRRRGETTSLLHGVHVDAAHARGSLARLHAALATQGASALVAMQTAATLHRLRWLPAAWSFPDATVHVAVNQHATRRHRSGLRLHRRLIDPVDRVIVNGVPCMSVTRTLVELARDRGIPELLVVQIIDGALRDARTTRAELLACLARFPGERGVARARGLVRRSREGVDSPQETKMRLILEDGGITEIDVNIEIRNECGDIEARGDLGIRRLLIWAEYDGYDEHTKRKTFRGDRVRDRWVQRRGWHVMRFADQDLERPEWTCREWQAAIADAPARIGALDRCRSPEVAAARLALGFDS